MIGHSRSRFRFRILSLRQTEPFIPRRYSNLGLDPISNGFRAAIYSGYLASASSTLTLRLGEHLLNGADRTLFADFRQIDNKLDTVLFPADDLALLFEVVIDADYPGPV